MAQVITPHRARHSERHNADGRINAATADWLSRHAEGKSEIRPELSNSTSASDTQCLQREAA